jgi:hypothetical protein
LLAAFAPHTGHAIGRVNHTKTAEDILHFLSKTVVPEFREAGKIYVVWDNFSSHKKSVNLWTEMPAGIEFIWTPTNASWLNLDRAVVPGSATDGAP